MVIVSSLTFSYVFGSTEAETAIGYQNMVTENCKNSLKIELFRELLLLKYESCGEIINSTSAIFILYDVPFRSQR